AFGEQVLGKHAVVYHEVPDVSPVLETPAVLPEKIEEEVPAPVEAEPCIHCVAGRDLGLDKVKERVVHVKKDRGYPMIGSAASLLHRVSSFSNSSARS